MTLRFPGSTIIVVFSTENGFMENSMDDRDQLFEGNRSLTSQNEHLASPAFRQEQPTASAEQRLFKRITRWTLLLGILIGIVLVFYGVMEYDFFLAPKGSFHIATPAVDALLVLFSFIPFQWVSVSRGTSESPKWSRGKRGVGTIPSIRPTFSQLVLPATHRYTLGRENNKENLSWRTGNSLSG